MSEVVEISLDEIVVPEWRIRREAVKDRSFEELKEGMRVNGLLSRSGLPHSVRLRAGLLV